jgi:hypothetical protein
MSNDPGILAIWNDCKPGGEADYEAWYRGEHLRERVGLPGFICGRRYVSVDGSSPRYFTFYETESADVLSQPVYLERGANPTPMTTRIMQTVFQNMTRTVCRRHKKFGEMSGAVVIAARASAGEQAGRIEQAWSSLCKVPHLLRAGHWQSAEPAGLEPSAEEKIRGRDNKIAACFVAEFADDAEAATAMTSIGAALPGLTIGSYRLICTLEHSEIDA